MKTGNQQRLLLTIYLWMAASVMMNFMVVVMLTIGTYDANGVLQNNGLLQGTDKHFVDLLQSVPDFRFGDTVTIGSTGITYTASANGTNDISAYAGALSNFTITKLKDANGNVLLGFRWYSNIAGTGNALDNVITGNSGNNTLNGGDGNGTSRSVAIAIPQRHRGHRGRE